SVASSVAMILGVAGHVPALLVSACAATVLLSDQQLYSNHMLLLVTLSTLIGLSGAARAIRVFELKRTEQVPYWPSFLIKAQITTLYAWTAISKVNPQYLSGEVIGSNLRPWVPVGSDLLPSIAVLSIAAEAFLAVALWLPCSRWLGFLVGAGLHIGILVFLLNPAPLIPFALLMLGGYAQFTYASMETGQWKMPALMPRARARASIPVGTDS
ncbi:MAG TPA: HTTM domain-containing protein, partial [Arthrobacter sp.]